ncbi:hypothetical protein ACJMK2_022089 [Sinanodonta woodiana]|uniref:VWFD domain-containing protein n=1 Tax=Sinanodonta woodiana TaxID=1069815 RepID=A0ABD3TIQ3_SINWO
MASSGSENRLVKDDLDSRSMGIRVNEESPPQPIVTFLSKGTDSIYINLTRKQGHATRYEITGIPTSGDETSVQNGTFSANENMTMHIFTTSHQPGTCFNFTVQVISGFGEGACTSDDEVTDGVCFAPSKPRVSFVDTGNQSIIVTITIDDGLATSYEITGTPTIGGNEIIDNGTFPPNLNTSVYVFTSDNDPGTCFNFRIIAISGYGSGAGRSEPVTANCICYAPSKPHVSFVAIGTQSIRVTITIVDGLATSYEIIGTPVIGGNDIINNGTFPPNLNTGVHVFTSDNEPGTCFDFRIIAISGYGSSAQRSEPVTASGICYDPSKPNVNIVPEGIQSVEVSITKGDGEALSYEIVGTPVTGGDVSIQNGTFRSTETSISHNFTTSDLPGTCFVLQIIAISGSGQWAGRSEPVVKNDVCYVTGPISRPMVQPDIRRLPSGRHQLVFYCDFEPSSDPTVVYTVRWYMDRIDEGSLLTSFAHLKFSSKEAFRSTTLLSERNITLGITLFCTVSAKKLDITVPSEPYFAGFKITPDDAVSIQDSEEATLYIQSTVPFSCADMNEECFLNINMFYRESEADNCLLPAAAALVSCGVPISSRKWNETHTLRIGVKHAQNLHSISRAYHIKFKTDDNFGYHEMFRNYTIPVEIQVNVSTDTSDLNGKECHAISDPHMLTFDGRYYENQNNGTYILYKHSTKLTQVQMKTGLCHGIPQGPPYCPCGVAIAAGRDVFVIDRCSTPIKIYMPKCDDGTLKGKVKTDGKSYQIHLPTGSLVKINAGISFNIYLYPSVSDRRATSGLCGYLDNDQNNDFTLRNGSSVPENEFEVFNSNWEVKPDENLFNISNYEFLQMWTKEMNMCICGQYQGGHNGQSDNCSPDSRNFCPDNSLNDSLAAMCNGLIVHEPRAFVDFDQNDHNASSSNITTNTEIPSMRNYTENSASDECWFFLNSSKLFKKCSEIPDIDPSSFAKTCVKDAMITSTMNWASTHLDSAQKSCLYQVIVNQPLPEDLRNQFNASVFQNSSVDSSNGTRKRTYIYTHDFRKEIELLACPMDCSGHGICREGKCSCEETFGDVDCSVDLREPPLVYGIPDRGVCDLQTKGCENVSVLGNNFVESEKLSCRLTLYKIKVNGTIIPDTMSFSTKGTRISFAEVSCKIEDVRSKRSVQFSDDLDTVAIVYGVAVSNNNKNFSQDTSLLLYDSLCLDCKKTGFDIACKLKEGFVLENRKCIKKVIPSTPTDMESKQVMVIAASMGSALVLLVSLVLVCCVLQRRKRKQYKKEQREREYQELREMEKKKEYYGIAEEVYDQIKEEQDTYYSIHDNSLNTNELKESEERYVKLGTTQTAETNESLSKTRQDECISDGEKPDIPYRPSTLPKVTIATDANSK